MGGSLISSAASADRGDGLRGPSAPAEPTRRQFNQEAKGGDGQEQGREQPRVGAAGEGGLGSASGSTASITPASSERRAGPGRGRRRR